MVKSTLFLQRKNLVPSHHPTPTPSISVYAQVTPAAENSMFFTHAILILTHIHKIKNKNNIVFFRNTTVIFKDAWLFNKNIQMVFSCSVSCF